MKETGYSILCVAKCWICSLLKNSNIPGKMKNILQYYTHLRTIIIQQGILHSSWGIRVSDVFKFLATYKVSLIPWVIWLYGCTGFKNMFDIFTYEDIQTEPINLIFWQPIGEIVAERN